MDKETIYLLKNVNIVREKGGSFFELHIPDFVAYPSECIAIVGESGCGKSTLLDILALILIPDVAQSFLMSISTLKETINVLNTKENILSVIRKSYIGYVMQYGGLLSFLNVKKNILLPCELNGKKDYIEHFNILVHQLKIDDQLEKKPQYLSGGQRQRVAIARALIHNPLVILADEPTAAVDKHNALEIMIIFKKLTQQLNATLIIVSHDTNLVNTISDRTYTFNVSYKGHMKTHSLCYEKNKRP